MNEMSRDYSGYCFETKRVHFTDAHYSKRVPKGISGLILKVSDSVPRTHRDYGIIYDVLLESGEFIEMLYVHSYEVIVACTHILPNVEEEV